eukprot:6179589-Pleurochrysis_carterae.AAC.1
MHRTKRSRALHSRTNAREATRAQGRERERAHPLRASVEGLRLAHLVIMMRKLQVGAACMDVHVLLRRDRKPVADTDIGAPKLSAARAIRETERQP